jgi:hypothetical protein
MIRCDSTLSLSPFRGPLPLTFAIWLTLLCLQTVLARSSSSYASSTLSDFVDYQTFELDGEIVDMMWCGQNDETILVQTGDGSIYRSRDRGNTWKRLKSLMQKQGSLVADTTQDVSF